MIIGRFLVAACGGSDAAQSFDSIEEMGAVIEAETEIVCNDWFVSDGPGLVFPYTEAADCNGWVLMYLQENENDAQEAVDFLEGTSWLVAGPAWTVTCLADRAALDFTAIHDALGGELIEPTG